MTDLDVCTRCERTRTPSARKFGPDYCMSCLNDPARIPEAAADYLAHLPKGKSA